MHKYRCIPNIMYIKVHKKIFFCDFPKIKMCRGIKRKNLIFEEIANDLFCCSAVTFNVLGSRMTLN